jgi:hypothetical protein
MVMVIERKATATCNETRSTAVASLVHAVRIAWSPVASGARGAAVLVLVMWQEALI